MGQARLRGVDVRHGPTAWPPAQPGSIWVTAGRSAAEPATAELGQDPPLPTPRLPAQKPLRGPSGLPPGPSTAPARASAGARRVRAHKHAGLLPSPPHAAPTETTSAQLGHLGTEPGSCQKAGGPGTQGSQTTQSGQATAHVNALHMHAHTHRGRIGSQSFTGVDTRACVPLPGAQPGRAGAVIGSRPSSLPAFGLCTWWGVTSAASKH